MPKNRKNNIILTGFMATGKTTIGKMLAKQLHLKFVDTDETIISRQGLSIPEIFEHLGEENFRKMETTIAGELAQQEGLVVSTGGRMMLDQVNVELLTQSGRVFCLTATAEEILSRLGKDTLNSRPLLAVPDPKKKIIELLEERKRGYHRFQKVTTSGKTPPEVAREILAIINKTEPLL